jgi:hypothetical protein
MSTQHATVPLKAGAEYQPASAYDTQTLKVSDVHTI